MGEESKVTTEINEATETNENKTEQETKTTDANKTTDVNVEETKTQGVNEFLKALGVEKKEDLQAIVDAYNEQVESRKSDLEKANDSNKSLTKRLVEEKERADIAEAKLAAILLGAKKELVDDLVVIAKARTTGDKKIIDIVEEIKNSNSGSVYFVSEEAEETKNRTVTRTTSKVQEKKQKEEQGEVKGSGLAERLFKNKQKTKNHYFS